MLYYILKAGVVLILNNHQTMENNMHCTTDLSNFGYRELKLSSKLLTAYQSSKDLTKQFEYEGVHIMFNRHSGYVFLTNSDYQVAILDDEDNLVDFLTCFECGTEGTYEDIKQETENINPCCSSMLKEYEEYK